MITYSFPCQDLSLAGQGAGMGKGENTRSGLLWQVERILMELDELPQILLMENVPQVIGRKHIKDFHKWREFLENLGYKNYVKNLNAKDYGIPQTRNRTFMVSLLSDDVYIFPKPFELKYKLKDFLENNVDERYYLTDKQIDILSGKNYHNPNFDRSKTFRPYKEDERDVAYTITTKAGQRSSDNFIKTRPDTLGVVVIDEKGGIATIDNSRSYESEKKIYSENGSINTFTSSNLANKSKILTKEKMKYRIRKLTPRECYRLMGVRDDDIDKVTCSNAQQYKQAGNSIVVDVLMTIFKQFY